MAKVYVVWQGRTPGIYHSWESCKAQVDGFSGAKYRSFKTLAEANSAFSQGQSGAVQQNTRPSASQSVQKTRPKQSNESVMGSIADRQLAIFCDGACDPNPGPAGSGIGVYHYGTLTKCFYGRYHQGSNNTAELLALYHSLLLAQQQPDIADVLILSDSSYSINVVTQWAAGWEKKGWVRNGNQPVKNLDLIQPLYQLYQSLKDRVEIVHVAAHVGIEGNEIADRMSVVAINEQQPEMVEYSQELDIDEILSMKRG